MGRRTRSVSDKQVVLAARLPSPARARLEITPDQREYEQLCRDLNLLRRLGAPTNTHAIIEAVHEHAERGAKMEPQRSKKSTGQRGNATRSRDRR